MSTKTKNLVNFLRFYSSETALAIVMKCGMESAPRRGNKISKFCPTHTIFGEIRATTIFLNLANFLRSYNAKMAAAIVMKFGMESAPSGAIRRQNFVQIAPFLENWG